MYLGLLSVAVATLLLSMSKLHAVCLAYLCQACQSCILYALYLQVAVELLKLTEDHGRDAWVNPTLNKKPYSIAGVGTRGADGGCCRADPSQATGSPKH